MPRAYEAGRLGSRGLRPSLAQASSRLETLRTPEGAPVPANTLAELRRDMARLHFVKQQIKDVEATRAKRLQRIERCSRSARSLRLRLATQRRCRGKRT